MIRSKAALIEALAMPGAILHGMQGKWNIAGETVHAQAAVALMKDPDYHLNCRSSSVDGKEKTYALGTEPDVLTEPPKVANGEYDQTAKGFNNPGHIDPKTERWALTVEEAAKYTLKEGERMYFYSKAAALRGKDPWKRLAVVACGPNGAKVQIFGGGWMNVDPQKVMYVAPYL